MKKHERIHTGDKPFSCSQCDYKFLSSSHLKRCKTTHNSDKPLGCSNFTYGCSREDRSHEDTRKSPHWSKSFQLLSVQCGYKCTRLYVLKINERTNTDKLFSCLQCDYKCSTSNDLTKHKRIHYGDKPFSCFQYDKSSTSSTLINMK